MKKIIFLIFLLSFSIKAQDIKDSTSLNCVTRTTQSQKVPHNITPEELHVPTGPHDDDIDYCITIYAHKLTKSDGSMGVSDTYITSQINYLNANFGGGFTFVWDETINTIANTSIYNTNIEVDASNMPSYDFSSLISYSNDNGLDIYFTDRNFGAAGVANGKADHSQIVMGPISDDPTNGGGNSPDGIIHEVGHTFGLFHTYHSTFGNGQTQGNNENQDGLNNNAVDAHKHLVECPNQSQTIRKEKGDFVEDTPADNGEFTSFNPATCLGQQLDSTPGECDVDSFPPISYANYMTDSSQFHTTECDKEFTSGQYRRMKFFLSNSNFPHMNELLTNCPSPCDDCQGAEGTLDNIVDNATDCDTFELERPFLGNNCGDVVRIFWDYNNSTEYEEIQPGQELSYDYDEDGSYLIKMIVLRDASICEGIEREIPITINCNSNPTCIDCNETGDLIMDSITPIDVIGTNPCGNYKLEIPEEVFECYNVLFNSGEDQNDLNPITSQDLYDDAFFFNYSTNGTYTPRIILIDLATGTSCYDEMAQDLTVSCHTEPCTNCKEDGNEIFNSIAMTPKGCGRYQVEVPLETLECYIVQIYNGINNSWTTINPDDLTNGFYVFEYDQNGTYTVAIRLINIASGIKDVCYINKRKVVIDCCPLSCKEVAQGIEVTNGGCGPNYFVPFGTNDCFSVFVNGGSEPFPIITEIFDGTNYGSNANYITIIDNLTGEVCETITDIPNFPGCFTGPFDNTKYKKFISVYPNPFSTEIYFKDSLDRSITKVEIYNTYGMRIKSQSYSERTPIAIDKGAPGLYFAKVYFEDGTIETIELIKK